MGKKKKSAVYVETNLRDILASKGWPPHAGMTALISEFIASKDLADEFLNFVEDVAGTAEEQKEQESDE